MKEVDNFYKNKNVLVTGGAGFIGSHIVEMLVNLNAKVTILDNFSSGNLNNIRNVMSRVNIIYGDITNKYTCLSAVKNNEIVFHLAALVSVAYSTIHPES